MDHAIKSLGSEIWRNQQNVGYAKSNAEVAKTVGVVLVRVGDFFNTVGGQLSGGFSRWLRRRCAFGPVGRRNATFVGWKISDMAGSNKNRLSQIAQKEYEPNPPQIDVRSMREKELDAEATPRELIDSQTRMGRLIWMGAMTRPDIDYQVAVMASSCWDEITEANLIDESSTEIPKW